MQNNAFRLYLIDFLEGLGRKDDRRRRFTFDDILVTSGLSKSALYNWLAGAPPTQDSINKLVQGLHALLQSAPNPHDSIRNESPEKLRDELSKIVSAAAWPPFGHFAYRPISGLPPRLARSPEAESWSFLGHVVDGFLRASGRGETEQYECDVTATLLSTGSVLVGLFGTPDRTVEWDFVRTPIVVPLNAVVLKRDVAALAARQNRNEDEYLARIRAALWQTLPEPVADFSLTDEIEPITADNEAGRTYLVKSLSFEEDVLKAVSPVIRDSAGDAPKASVTVTAFRDKLLELSNKLKQSNATGKLPIAVIDEATCFRLRKRISEVPGASSALLLSEPSSEVSDLLRSFRPRHSVLLAIPRKQSGPADSGILETTKRAFEEYLWSNGAPISHQYVRLYRQLIESFPGVDLGPLYFLRWISLEILPPEITEADNWKGPVPYAPQRAAPYGGCESDFDPWRDILYSAKVLILQDRTLRKHLQTAMSSIENSVRTTNANRD